jgi:hypothetical protein
MTRRKMEMSVLLRKRKSKEWFLHHGYEYIEDMSETELAKYNDIKRIYDAGKIKWYKRLH